MRNAMSRRVLAVIVTLAMILSLMPSAVFAGIGPKVYTNEDDPNRGYAYIRLGAKALFGLDITWTANVEPVNGEYLLEPANGGYLKYDPDTNTIYMAGVNEPDEVLDINMMGDDLVLFLEGTNTLGGITVWGDRWGGSLRVKGHPSGGTLKLTTKGIHLEGEMAEAVLAVEKGVTIDASNTYFDKGAISVTTTNADPGIYIAGTISVSDDGTPEIVKYTSYLPYGHYEGDEWVGDGAYEVLNYYIGVGETPCDHIVISDDGTEVGDIVTPPTITTATLPAGYTGKAYSETLKATAGSAGGTIKWALHNSVLPSGLTLSEAGVLSGTPENTGSFTFTVKAWETDDTFSTKTLSLQILEEPPVITTESLNGGKVGEAYSATLTATKANGDADTFTWSVTDGKLPAGLSLAASTGVISGTPSASGIFNFTVKALQTSQSAGSAQKELSIVVADVDLAAKGDPMIYLSETDHGTLVREREYSVYLYLNRELADGETASIRMDYTDVNGDSQAVTVGREVYYCTVYGNGTLPKDCARVDRFVFDVNGNEVEAAVGKDVAPRLHLTLDGDVNWRYSPVIEIYDGTTVIFNEYIGYYSNKDELTLDSIKAGTYKLDLSGYVDGYGYISYLDAPIDIVLTNGQIIDKTISFTTKTSEYVALQAKAGDADASASYFWYADAACTQLLSTSYYYPVLVGSTVYAKAVPIWGSSIYYTDSDPVPVTGVAVDTQSEGRTIEIPLVKRATGTISGIVTSDDPDGGAPSAVKNRYIYLTRYGSYGYSSTEWIRTGADGSYTVENVTAGSRLSADIGDLRWASLDREIAAAELDTTVNVQVPLSDGLVTFGNIRYLIEDDRVNTLRPFNFSSMIVKKADGTELAIRRSGDSFVLVDPTQVSEGEVLTLELYYYKDKGFWESELSTTFAFGTRAGKLYAKLPELTMTKRGYATFSWSGGNGMQGFELLLYGADGLLYSNPKAVNPSAGNNVTRGVFSTPRLEAGTYKYAVVNTSYLNGQEPGSYENGWTGGTDYAAAGTVAITDKARTDLTITLPSTKADSGVVNLSASNIAMTQRYEGLVDLELVCQLNTAKDPDGDVKVYIFTNQNNQTNTGSGYVNTRSFTINGKVFDLNRWSGNGIIQGDGTIELSLTPEMLKEFGGFPLTINTTFTETVGSELKASAWLTIGGNSYFIGDCETKTGLLSIYAPANSVDGEFTVYGYAPVSFKGHNSDYTVNVFADGVLVASTKADRQRGLYKIKLNLPDSFLEEHHKIEFVAAGQYGDGSCTYVSEPAYTVFSANDGALHAYWLEWQSHAGDKYQQIQVWDDGDPVNAYKSYYRGGNANDKANIRWRMQFDNVDNVSDVQVVVPRNGEVIVIDAEDVGGGVYLTDGYYFEGTAPDGAYITYNTKRFAGADTMEPLSANDYDTLRKGLNGGTYISQMKGTPTDENGMTFLMAVESGGDDVIAVTWLEKELEWDASDITDLNKLVAEKEAKGRYPHYSNLIYWSEDEIELTGDEETTRTWATDGIYRYADNAHPGHYVFVREIHTIDTRIVTTWSTFDSTKTETMLVLGDGSGEYGEEEFADIDPAKYTLEQYTAQVEWRKTDLIQDTWLGFFNVFGAAMQEYMYNLTPDGELSAMSIYGNRTLVASLTYKQAVKGYNRVKKIWNSDASKLARKSYKWAQGAPPTAEQLRALKTFLDKNPCLQMVFKAFKSSDDEYQIFGEFNAAFYKIGVGWVGKILGTATNGVKYIEGSAAKAGETFAKAMVDGAKEKFLDSKERELFGDQGKNLAREMYRALIEIEQHETGTGGLCDEGLKWEYWPTNVYDPEAEYGSLVTHNTEQRQSAKAGPQGRYDPSGYIYEAVPSNRVEGATVTLYTLEDVTETKDGNAVTAINGGTRVIADAGWFGIEPNPQTSTDGEGRYQWFVPLGYWAVVAAKDGYETTDTRMSSAYGLNAIQHDDGWYMPVLPVQLDVNLPLVSYEAPKVAKVEANTEGVFVTFTKYMDEATLTANGAMTLFVNETLTNFAVSLVDHEKSSDADNAPYYTSVIRLNYSGAAEGDKVQLIIANSVKSYAGTRMEERYDSGEVAVVEQPQVETPAATPAAGTVDANVRVELSCATDGASIYYTADGSDPTAESKLYTGSILIGETVTIKAIAIKAGMKDSEIFTAEYTVNEPEPLAVLKPTATLNGSTVADNTTIYEGYLKISTETEGATIYYSTNGVCPKDDANSRIEYTGPILLTEGSVFFRIRAYKDGIWSDGLPLHLTIIKEPAEEPAEPDEPDLSEVEVPFVDIEDEDPDYKDAITWAYAKAITEGIDEDHFGPADGCTRAQAVTFLWREAGCPEPEGTVSFSDIPAGSYYEKAVAWALEQGITEGTTPETFSPDLVCTRAQMVTFLWRANGNAVSDAINPFTDVTAEDYYYAAVLWAFEKGITEGTAPDRFSPDDDCTRAQAVTFMHRNYLRKKKED